jgi:hypothetical protein
VAVLVWLAVLLSTAALVLSYVGRAILRPQSFADRAVATLSDPAVSDDVADRLTNAVTGVRGGDLLAVRPFVRAIAGSVVTSGPFRALFHRAVLEAHEAVVERHGGTVFVDVANASVLLDTVLKRVSPSAAKQIDAERVARLLTLHPGKTVLGIVRLIRQIDTAGWVLAIVSVLLAVAAIVLSADRRRTVRRLGIGLTLGGLLVTALYLVGAEVSDQLVPSWRDLAMDALWRAFLGGLQVEALAMAGAGVVLAAAGSPRRGRLWPTGADLRRRRLEAGALTPARRHVMAAGVIGLGIVILLEPAAVLRIAILTAGLYVLYWGAREVLGGDPEARPAPTPPRRAALRRWRFVGPGVAIVVLALVAVAIGAGEGDGAPAVAPLTCNGYVALCSRPLNDVAFAATHNSMASVTIPNWLFGQQDGTISDQLSYGIRGFLIDTYYGDAVASGVRTDLQSLPKRQAAVQAVGKAAVEAAERLASRIGYQGKGRRGIFLCHGFCEIGAVSLDSALEDLRSFLVSNPGDVVIVINQDEGVTPADIQRAFDRAGLLDLVYRGPLGPFPTLREMIDSNQRLVVMAENDAGKIPWYHLAYANALQETPFRFTNPSQLTEASKLAASCRDNRGSASAPLFLLNHWVDTTPAPRASLAAEVNARSELLARAQTCERIRHRLPNLVAVDFFRRGDVLGVVNTLNGVSSS